MSDYTRYLLASAGIVATEQDIAAIDASGYPGALVSLLSHYAALPVMPAEHQCEEMQPGVFRHVFTPPEWNFNPSYPALVSFNWSGKSMHKAGRRLDQIATKERREQRKRKVRRRQRRAMKRRHNGGRH